MPISRDEAERITAKFARDYPGALELAYLFRPTTHELYGPDYDPGKIKGAYSPSGLTHNGQYYRGRVDIPLDHITDADDMLVTLRHEVLGHHGVNTFTSAEKRTLLEAICHLHFYDPTQSISLTIQEEPL